MLLSSDTSRRLERKFGAGFPKDLKKATAQEIKHWLHNQRQMQESVMRERRLIARRLRHFRAGYQWISTRDNKTYHVPKADKNTIQITDNRFGPALDFRHNVVTENRPGFKHMITKSTVAAREQAEAQQAVAQYYYFKLRAWNVFSEALYHAQTDGVAFIQVFIDPNMGENYEQAEMIAPGDERYEGLVAEGYERRDDGMILVSVNEFGDLLSPDAPVAIASKGDLSSRVVLAYDTLADPEAKTFNGTTNPAKWFAVRRVRDVHIARIETGNDKLEVEVNDDNDDGFGEMLSTQRSSLPFPVSRQRIKEGVYDTTVFLRDNEDFSEGAWIRTVGTEVIATGDSLPGGKIPFAAVGDGSPDPELYKRPIATDWVASQMAINSVESMIAAHIRAYGAGRILALKGTQLYDTLTNGMAQVTEYEGAKPEFSSGTPMGQDAWSFLNFLIKKFEDDTGHSAFARGQVTGQQGGGLQDVSGRAVLATREVFERQFGPLIRAAAEGATEWAELIVAHAAFLFKDEPAQLIPVVGDRPDLARRISAEQLEGECLVFADPQTMMPMPAALRHQVLFDYRKEGLISDSTFLRRSPYSDITNLHNGDADQWQRAQKVNMQLEERIEEFAALTPIEMFSPDRGLPILWADEPLTHMEALREIILNDRHRWALRKLAMDRYGLYEMLARAKADPMLPVPAEVLGVPLDRLTTPVPPMAAPTADQAPQPAAPVSAVMPPSQMDMAAPLGSMGNEEA